MMDSEPRISLKTKPFSGNKPEEWGDFKLRMQAVLEGADLLENLLKKKPAEVEATTTTVTANAEAVKALKDWKDKDRKIYFMLVLYTTEGASSAVQQFAEDTEPGKVSGHGRL
jgi:hypothetical protein